MNPTADAMPDAPATCPRCRTALPPGVAASACPRCLLGLAAPQAPARPGPKVPELAELQPLFPDYELQALLGRGGMGAVYRARQTRLDRLVAIKVLLPELVANPAFAERFEREAKALAKLAHPGIVAVYDFGVAGPYYYLVMEHVDGANLRDVLAQGGLTTRDVLELVPQLCDALQYAHDHRIVHRDIKPENVLVDFDGRVRVADFGLAKLLRDDDAALGLTQTEQVMGTPHYMAPEQMRASRSVDHRADLYSLGVVLYEMLTGQLPIGRFQPPSARDEAARGFDPVVMKSLENDPDRRYQAAADVKRDLGRAAVAPGARGDDAAAPTIAPATTTPPAASRALPWQTWIYVAGIAVACALPWHWQNGNRSVGTLRDGTFVPREEWVPETFPLLPDGDATGYAATAFGLPLWLTLVAAGLASLFATLRAAGLAAPQAVERIAVAAGATLAGATLAACVVADKLEARIGLYVACAVFAAWTLPLLRGLRPRTAISALVVAAALVGALLGLRALRG